MEFDLTAFMLSPSTEEFERCRKDDLIKIADFFKISVSRHATKKELKTVLPQKLEEEQILPELTVTSDVKEGQLVLDLEENSPQVAQLHSPLLLPPDPTLGVRLKEWEVRRQEHQTKLLCVRELEMEMEIKKNGALIFVSLHNLQDYLLSFLYQPCAGRRSLQVLLPL